MRSWVAVELTQYGNDDRRIGLIGTETVNGRTLLDAHRCATALTMTPTTASDAEKASSGDIPTA